MLPVRRVVKRQPSHSLAKEVRDALGGDGGSELMQFWLDILRDRNMPWKDRKDAARELGNRGWGKSMQPIEVSNADIAAADLNDLPDSHLEFLAAVVAALKGKVLTGDVKGRVLAALTLLPEPAKAIPAEFSEIVEGRAHDA